MYDKVIKEEIKNNLDHFGEISEKQLNITMGRNNPVHKEYRHLVIEELLQMGIIKVKCMDFRNRIFCMGNGGNN